MRMAIVNADLYDFLKENEMHLYTENFDRNKTVYGMVIVHFYDMKRFAEIVGEFPFEEEGLNIVMKKDYVCITINDIIEGHDQYLSSYKNCFEEDEWKHYEDRIKEMEFELAS